MKYIANAFRHKAQVRSLAPNKEIERHVEELPARIRGRLAAIGDPDVGLLPEVGAPVGVVLQQLLPEATDDAEVEGVDVVRGRGEAHLEIGEVEDEVLPLVPDVVLLEAEEEAEPVEQVIVRAPQGVRRLAEVADGAQGGAGCTDLREVEGGVVGSDVVDWDDVVRWFLITTTRRGLAWPGSTRRVAGWIRVAAVAHWVGVSVGGSVVRDLEPVMRWRIGSCEALGLKMASMIYGHAMADERERERRVLCGIQRFECNGATQVLWFL